jgi:hypothetical protein
MMAADKGASTDIMQLLLDRGAVASINTQDKVALLSFNLEL